MREFRLVVVIFSKQVSFFNDFSDFLWNGFFPSALTFLDEFEDVSGEDV